MLTIIAFLLLFIPTVFQYKIGAKCLNKKINIKENENFKMSKYNENIRNSPIEFYECNFDVDIREILCSGCNSNNTSTFVHTHIILFRNSSGNQRL